MIVRTISLFRGYITCKSMYFYQKESRGEVYNFHSFSPSFFPPAKPHGVNFTLQTTPQELEQGKLYWGQAHVDVKACPIFTCVFLFLPVFIYVCIYYIKHWH